MPELEKYRFVKKIKPPEDLGSREDDLIYEALPALYHYNGNALGRAISDIAAPGASEEVE